MTHASYILRPLGPWLEGVTDPRASSSRFRVKWDETLDLLAREVWHLGAETFVLQVDVTEQQLRQDGTLRARSQVGDFPGVRVSFDSIHGPLTYATDAYAKLWSGAMPGWQANARAIALGLEALRAVDRYGITRRGEQYTGWRQIADRPATMTPAQAAEFIAHWADQPDRFTGAQILTDPGLRDRALKVAAARTHPDLSPAAADTFARLTAARAVLAATDRRVS